MIFNYCYYFKCHLIHFISEEWPLLQTLILFPSDSSWTEPQEFVLLFHGFCSSREPYWNSHLRNWNSCTQVTFIIVAKAVTNKLWPKRERVKRKNILISYWHLTLREGTTRKKSEYITTTWLNMIEKKDNMFRGTNQ